MPTKIYVNNHGTLFINDRQMASHSLSLDPYLKGLVQWYKIYETDNINPIIDIALSDIRDINNVAYINASHFEMVFWWQTSNVISNLDTVHSKIHTGETYTSNWLAVGVANDGFARLRFKATTKQCHLVINYNSDGKAYFRTYYGTTYTANGTAPEGGATANLSSFQRNSIPNIAPTATVFHTPTVNVLGSRRGNQLINGGTGNNTTGGGGGTRLESIINPNEDLLIEIQNKSGAAGTKDIGFILDWYEVTPTP